MSASPTVPTPLADQAARDLAVSEFERAVALEAGAGTGKTRSLVARLATWLLGPGWAVAAAELEARREADGGGPVEPSDVAARVAEGAVAITFTEAAAAEMSRRLGELLADLAGGRTAEDLTPLPAPLESITVGDLGARADRLAANLSRLRLQTIHGFCHRLLADHPFEAGLHPTLAVDAEGEELASAASEVLIERLRLRQPQLLALVREGVSPSELHEALIRLVSGGARKEDFATDPFDDATCAAILARLAVPLGVYLRELVPLAAAAAKQVRTLPPARDALLHLEVELRGGSGDRTGLESLAALARDTSGEWQKILSRYGKEGLNKTEEKILGPAGEAYLERAKEAREALEELLAFDLRRFELARQAFAPLVEQVRYRLDRAGVLTFDDLLDRASELLQRSTPVRRSLRREIRQLLVDEFQDTDRRQCELLAALALGEEKEDGGVGPRPGLFIVGDPKQSIYAWRKADLASYEGFLARMQAAGGTSARLSVNFRSVPAVLDEVARAIAPVMVAEAGVQPRFEPLLPGPKLAGAGGFRLHDRHPVEHWLSWDPTDFANGAPTKAARANSVEAAAIAGDIRELHDAAGKPWSSFAILLRARKSLEVYLEALRRAGVPYAVQRDRSYYRRREVIDLACAVRAILDPADLLALVAFLRSPLVGVPDAAWIPLWRGGFAAAMVELERPEGIAAAERAIAAAEEAMTSQSPPTIPGLDALRGWPLALTEAVRTVACLRAEFRALPIAGWIERLRAWLLPEPLAAARFLGRFGLANVERLLTRLERELGEESDPHRALSRLQRAVEEEKDAEDARPPDVSSDAVAVMTIHTAKGLEYDQVYLAQIHRGNRPDRSAIAEGASEIVEGVAGGHRNELLLLGAPSPGFLVVDRLRRRSRQAEAVRLLYVALTRAKERLVICGNWNPLPRAFEPGRAKTWVDLLAERPPGNLLDLGVNPEVSDAAGVPWRLAARPRDSGPALAAIPRSNQRAAAIADIVPPNPFRVAGVASETRRRARQRADRQRLERVAGGVNTLAPPFETSALTGDEPSRSLALATGVALHRALELEALAESAPDSWRSATETAFLGELPGATAGERSRLQDGLELLTRKALFARLRALRPHVLARELPLLAGVPDEAEGSGHRALDGVVGTLDLLYRDPDSGEIVVADFKTDEIPADAMAETVAAKVARYRPQLELYGRAVEAALSLDRPPRLELWLLGVDRIELVS